MNAATDPARETSPWPWHMTVQGRTIATLDTGLPWPDATALAHRLAHRQARGVEWSIERGPGYQVIMHRGVKLARMVARGLRGGAVKYYAPAEDVGAWTIWTPSAAEAAGGYQSRVIQA